MSARAAVAAIDPMLPTMYQIQRRKRELADTFRGRTNTRVYAVLDINTIVGSTPFTWELASAEGDTAFEFEPGQFNMLYQFGIGEVPISISGDPAQPEVLIHTIRSVGTVTRGMAGLRSGDILGVRGPFGTGWPVSKARASDVVIVAGGLGLAPLRPAIYQLLANRADYGNICIYYGARIPADILFLRQLQSWRGRFDLTVEVTVDRADKGWSGRVCVVTRLLSGGFDPANTVAMLCGPEVMMRFAANTLNEQGVKDSQIYMSMERNMKCAVGFCGHCQFGTSFVCKDGPVYRLDRIRKLLTVREL